MKRRRIVWSDGKARTIEETARKIQIEYETGDRDAVISHLSGWLKMSDPPTDLDDEQLEQFEDQIDD